jgi:hypothetical protein
MLEQTGVTHDFSLFYQGLPSPLEHRSALTSSASAWISSSVISSPLDVMSVRGWRDNTISSEQLHYAAPTELWIV